eukprot:EG_transcript_32307
MNTCSPDFCGQSFPKKVVDHLDDLLNIGVLFFHRNQRVVNHKTQGSPIRKLVCLSAMRTVARSTSLPEPSCLSPVTNPSVTLVQVMFIVSGPKNLRSLFPKERIKHQGVGMAHCQNQFWSAK